MAARALVFDIWQDIVRYSVTYILLLFVVMSAFSVIYYSHVNRQTTSELHLAINQKFEEAGIVIAFPQRDVHLNTSTPLDVRILSPQSES